MSPRDVSLLFSRIYFVNVAAAAAVAELSRPYIADGH